MQNFLAQHALLHHHYSLLHIASAVAISSALTAAACRRLWAKSGLSSVHVPVSGAVPDRDQTRVQVAAAAAAAAAQASSDLPHSSDSDASSDDDGDDDVSDYGAPVTAGQQIDARAHSDFKMVFIIRTDLGMTKGKVAAQCCHACLACYKLCAEMNPPMLKAWERIGQAKVTLKCDSEDEMNELQAIAASLSLPARSIRDAGRTQIAAGSRTVLAIGPGPVSIVNQVTGHLKLY